MLLIAQIDGSNLGQRLAELLSKSLDFSLVTLIFYLESFSSLNHTSHLCLQLLHVVTTLGVHFLEALNLRLLIQ